MIAYYWLDLGINGMWWANTFSYAGIGIIGAIICFFTDFQKVSDDILK
jgi:hypothetical protein